MAYCPGRTLQERLRAGPLPPDEAGRLVLELARAVAAAHAQQVLHRDLKPANVILSEGDGAPRITDFGLARDLTREAHLTQAGDLVGTPYYIAPERFRGEGRPDPRVDVYSLGVILYECLTGRRPYDAQTPAELAEKVEAAPPLAPEVANPAVPPALARVCLEALERDPARRTPSALALAQALEGALAPAPGPAAAPGAGLVAATASPAPDRWLEALSLALLIIGGVVCGAVAVWAFG
jgi:serine/threonine-protein kinase